MSEASSASVRAGKSRGALVAGLQRAGEGPAKETARRALRAHDYVYDVFESAEGVAA